MQYSKWVPIDNQFRRLSFEYASHQRSARAMQSAPLQQKQIASRATRAAEECLCRTLRSESHSFENEGARK